MQVRRSLKPKLVLYNPKIRIRLRSTSMEGEEELSRKMQMINKVEFERKILRIEYTLA